MWNINLTSKSFEHITFILLLKSLIYEEWNQTKRQIYGKKDQNYSEAKRT